MSEIPENNVFKNFDDTHIASTPEHLSVLSDSNERQEITGPSLDETSAVLIADMRRLISLYGAASVKHILDQLIDGGEV